MGRRDPLEIESASAARATLTRQVCPNSSFRAMLAIAMTLYMSRFDNLGAVGPACLKMETYGTADEVSIAYPKLNLKWLCIGVL